MSMQVSFASTEPGSEKITADVMTRFLEAFRRRASAGASSRSVICFSAPRGSPAMSARAAAVTSESMSHPIWRSGRHQTPSQLLLPVRRRRSYAVRAR